MVTSPFQTPSDVRVASETADEMRAVDRIAVEDSGIELLQMMENAGRTLASHDCSVGDESALPWGLVYGFIMFLGAAEF